MLLYAAILLSFVALPLLVVWPVAGVALLFISKPIIDTTFAQPLLYGIHLTEIVGALVPMVVFGQMFFARSEEAWHRMPLREIWTVYAIDVFLFSLIIAYSQGFLSGANIFLRYINGFVGFYILQAFFHHDQGKRLKTLLVALIIAGLFPMGIGVYQRVTGTEWIHAEAETLTRYIGLYHDAFTVRYYAFQTLLALILYGALFSGRNLFIKISTLAYAVVSMVVMIGAYSKAGIVSLLMWVTSWTVLRKKIIALFLIITCAAFLGTYYTSSIIANITQVFHKEIGALGGSVKVERTFAGRWYGWGQMISRWEEFSWLKKVFGSGEVALGAHNDYLQILFHGGLLGLVLYLSLLCAMGFRIASNLRNKIDPMSIAALMLFLMWLVDTIGLVPSSYPGYQWFVWGMIGLSFRLREEEDRLREPVCPAERSAAMVNSRADNARFESPSLATRRRYPIIVRQKV